MVVIQVLRQKMNIQILDINHTKTDNQENVVELLCNKILIRFCSTDMQYGVYNPPGILAKVETLVDKYFY